MAKNPDCNYEVLHYGSLRFVTPYQEWHNERSFPPLPEPVVHGAGVRDVPLSRRVILVRQQRRNWGEFQEELLPPAHTETCGLGPPRPIEICRCRQGDHE
ncbi:hypothetical protein OHA02_52320 [Streptomyces phaeochromogenes]|nr:hypothetical protein [Streptomyces phaeochromogenes]